MTVEPQFQAGDIITRHDQDNEILKYIIQDPPTCLHWYYVKCVGCVMEQFLMPMEDAHLYYKKIVMECGTCKFDTELMCSHPESRYYLSVMAYHDKCEYYESQL